MTFLELDATSRIIRKLCATLCDLVYWIIAKIYELFITVARLNILTNGLGPIYQRITMILTIVMTFYITFEFVKYTVQPDTFSDKEKGAGSILKRVVVVVALLALMPNIFGLAYELQSRVIETNLIPKIILGTSNTDYAKYGNDFAANMLGQFYYYDEEVCAGGGGECKQAEEAVEENMVELREKGKVHTRDTINLKSNTGIARLLNETYPAINFTFDGVLPLLIGIFIAYILVLYSIDVGIRYAQLIFLQAIAPVAIMGYILPKKDGIFQKWGKQCITTYLDLFIRLIIINFVLLLTKVLGEAFTDPNSTIFNGMVITDGLRTFTYIVLILGLLVFAQRAPKLLSDLLPGLGGGGIGFGINPKERFDNIKSSAGGLWKAAKAPFGAAGVGRRLAGGAGGLLIGGFKNRNNGVGGVLKGAAAGAKSGFSKDKKGLIRGSAIARWKYASDTGEAVRQEIEDFKVGAGKGANPNQAIFNSEHWKNEFKEYERRKSIMEAYSKALSSTDSAVKDMKFMKQLEGAKQIAQANNNAEAAKLIENYTSDFKKLARQYASCDANSVDGRAALAQIRSKLGEITTAFASEGQVVTFDTEATEKRDAAGNIIRDAAGNAVFERDEAKWGNIKISVQQASKVAKAVAGETMDDGRTVADNSNSTIVKNATTGEYEINDLGKFAFNMGKVDDGVKNATNQMVTSDAYKNAQAYAKGISLGDGKK